MSLTEEEIAEKVTRLEESIRILSGKGGPDREKIAVITFLENIRIPFTTTDIKLTNPGEDPPDARFNDASFEIKEMLDSGRRRVNEYREELAYLIKNRKSLNKGGGSISICCPTKIIDELAEFLLPYSESYSPEVKASLDILIYYNHRSRWLRGSGGDIDVANLESQGWRSVSLTTGTLAIVYCASDSAPRFLKDNQRKIFDNSLT